MHTSFPEFLSGCSRSISKPMQAAAMSALLIASMSLAHAQERAHSKMVVIPPSSYSNTAAPGLTAHTNVRYSASGIASPSVAPSYANAIETPQSLACMYGLVRSSPGCNPATATNTPNGGSQTIAIVDAFDDPNAASDLDAFSAQWGLPFHPNKFQVIYAGGSEPAGDPTGGWELEESLDIEYAHAMAPNAKLYLVEANSDSWTDLFAATQVASNLVVCGQTTTCPAKSKGKGEVSMSWGDVEFSGETAYDSLMTTPGVVYFAASGDTPGPGYPCVSPNVVCAGGTSDSRNEFTGDLIGQITWQDGGGGISSYEPTPSYQAALAKQLGGQRGVPDVSADSNPYTGVWVYDSYLAPPGGYNWYIVGGTSVASPIIAGIVNAAGNFASSTKDELTTLYASPGKFNTIPYGACGYYSGTFASAGWDQCTGLGSPASLVNQNN